MRTQSLKRPESARSIEVIALAQRMRVPARETPPGPQRRAGSRRVVATAAALPSERMVGGLLAAPEPPQQLRRAVVFRIPCDGHSPAPRRELVALGNRLRRVVRPLHV